ncbi:MAG TPA: AAA family ATPase [Actinomycetota bacterium]|nr:AAA family ATPase [Actinomycetota bacterium]
MSRVVLAIGRAEIAEEVMHFLDRTGRSRVVGTASDSQQLAEAVRQLEPDAVVAEPSFLSPRSELDGSALLALDTTQSVATLRRAIRAGARGFYLWPAEREELAVAAARPRPGTEQDVARRASVIAVYGPRGGIGATFVATHLAAAFAARERACVLVDLDVVFADASSALGVPDEEPPRTMGHLLPLGEEIAPQHLTDVLWRHPRGFDVLLAPGDEVAATGIRASHYRAAIAAAQRTCDIVVLHVPRGLDEVARTGLELADRVVVVLGLDVLSFRDAKRAIAVAGVEDRCAFVINRAGRSEIAPADVERVFGRPPLAVLPAARGVPAAQDRGRLVPLRGRLGRSLGRLARCLIEELA